MSINKKGDIFLMWLDNVKLRKKEKKLTNEMLAERSGISIGTLNKLLSGATEDPKLSTLTALSIALGCSIDTMLRGEEAGSISPVEKELLEKFRALDASGRDTVIYILDKEYSRKKSADSDAPFSLDTPTVSLRLYDLAVSAGTGSYMADEKYEIIPVVSNRITESAGFAVRVSGDSMVPKYRNGDVLLISEDKNIENGEFGIFSVNGESYVKKYGGDRLISLNPAYKDIIFSAHDEVSCFGKVIGKIKK